MGKDESDPLASYVLGPDVRLGRVTTGVGETCRCGTRLLAGDERLKILNPPKSIEHLLSSRSFCSLPCVRAFLLEALAEMEALSSSNVDRTISDLREAYLDMSRAFSDLQFDLTDLRRYIP
jgi:hypothetical protein